MKSGLFVCAAAVTLSAVLGLARARPLPDQGPHQDAAGFVAEAGATALYTGFAGLAGAAIHARLGQHQIDHRVDQTQAEKKAALNQLKMSQERHDLALDQIRELKRDALDRENALTAAQLDVETQKFWVKYHQSQVPTVKEYHKQVLLCWAYQLELAVQRSPAATWPDTIGDDMWTKCNRAAGNRYTSLIRRPAVAFKKVGAQKQKERRLFQFSAPASIFDRPLALVHSPAVQHQIHNLQHVAAAGMREVHSLAKAGAREEAALEKAAVHFRPAGLLRAGEV
ncbi:MAG: hypothetical protein M1826_003025 [Phylliscum demangeonii]|nr:MAG: hypothetical protein M1826_003025 [Phylliscum demangeonii]